MMRSSSGPTGGGPYRLTTAVGELKATPAQMPTKTKAKANRRTRVPQRVLLPPKPLPVLSDGAVDRLRLDGKKLDLGLRDAVTDIPFNLSLTEAPTITLQVNDPERVITSAGILDRDRDGVLDGSVRLNLDGIQFALSRVERGDDFELVFEPRLVEVLRRDTKRRKAHRDQLTRAMFVYSLIREAERKHKIRIPVFIPELRDKQRIGRVAPEPETRSRRQTSKRDEDRKPGLPSGRLRGKGPVLTQGQLRNAELALDTAESDRAPERAMLALLTACIVEAPDFDNPTGGDRTSVGILQLLSTHLGGSTSTNGGRRDVQLVCHIFLTRGFTGAGGAIKLARENRSWSPGQIAQACQGSAHPGRYDQYLGQAKAILAAWTGGGGSIAASRGSTKTVNKRYAFTRGQGAKKESTWGASGRLAEEVGWRRFATASTFVMASDEELIRQRPMMTVAEGDDGIEDVAWTVYANRAVDEATLQVRAKAWRVEQGRVLELVDEGPASGRWLVSAVSGSMYGSECEVSLLRPARKKPEPAPETRTVTIPGRDAQASDSDGRVRKAGGAKGIVEDAAAIAAQFDTVVVSDYRPGDPKDHGSNDADKAARDIAVQGIDALVGPPSPKIDRAVVAIGRAFGKNYGDGKSTIIDTFNWRGFRIQIIWRTPLYGGHMGHIHIGARKL